MISIRSDQVKWLKGHHINLSSLVREVIDKEIEKHKSIEEMYEED